MNLNAYLSLNFLTDVYFSLNVKVFNKFKTSLILFLLVMFSFVANAQLEQNFSDNLSSKGIVIEGNHSLSSKNQEILLSYNFDKFRNEITRRKVSIVNGPMIELFSFDELTQLNISFDNEMYLFKKGEVTSVGLIPTITQLNIGIRLIDFESDEKWVTQ